MIVTDEAILEPCMVLFYEESSNNLRCALELHYERTQGTRALIDKTSKPIYPMRGRLEISLTLRLIRRLSARGILQKLRVNVLSWELDIPDNGPPDEAILYGHHVRMP